MNRISGVIFDMDGVLTDSELLWKEKIYDLVHQHVPEFTHEHQRLIVGKSLADIYELLHELFPEKMKHVDREEFFRIYEKFGLEEIYAHAKMIPGAKEYLQKVSEKYPTALASSALRPWVGETLRQHDLRSFFRTIVTGSDVKKAKPDPEIFLQASRKLDILPEYCLVIEDSHNGVEAAHRAGMNVWGFRNGFNDEQDLGKADAIFDDFTTLPLP